MVRVLRDRCGYCGSCVGVCPRGAIEMIDLFVRIDRGRCVGCGLCLKACPLGALVLEGEIPQTGLRTGISGHTD